jgi:phosphatidylserine decarboxylase
VVTDGYKFGAPPIILGIASWLVGLRLLAIVLLLLGAFVLYFFRDPDRAIPAEAGAVVSPADGRIVAIVDEAMGSRPGRRISIFLAIWNVHVNRAPFAGRIMRVDYRPGQFQMAMKETASAQNEQNIVMMETARGEMMFKQIAGLIARRVILWKKAGDEVATGERVGLVRFGSRVDLWLPPEAEITIKMGDNVAGGSSILARFPS